MDTACENTDVEIWHSPDDMKSRSVHMSKTGEAITLCVGGVGVTMPLADLHSLAVGDVEDRHESGLKRRRTHPNQQDKGS